MILSRISSKSQVTLPKAVRAALGIGDGDQVRWVIDDDGRVTVLAFVVQSTGDPDDLASDFATFVEWAGEADCKAFDHL